MYTVCASIAYIRRTSIAAKDADTSLAWPLVKGTALTYLQTGRGFLVLQAHASSMKAQRSMAGYRGNSPTGGNTPGTGRKHSSMPDGVIEENVVLFAVPKKGRTAASSLSRLQSFSFVP